MKKLVLLFSVLSIFLIPSMSFAQNSFYPIPSDGFSNWIIVTSDGTINGLPQLFKFDGEIHLKSNFDFQIPTVKVYNYNYDSGTWDFVVSNNNVSFGNMNNQYIMASNYDIRNYDGSVFFSPPPLPIVQVSGVEELPPVILQHGGTVLSAALMGFGLLLVVLLIPQLVKRFLY